MLLVEALAWLAVWGVFGRPAWFHWLLIPAFLALPTEIYLFIYYGQGISTHHLGIIAETSPKEAMEFLGRKVWLMGAVLLGVMAGGSRCNWRPAAAPCWPGAARRAGWRWLYYCWPPLWAYGWEFGVRAKPARRAGRAMPAPASRPAPARPSARR
jgi:hypothetical protein